MNRRHEPVLIIGDVETAEHENDRTLARGAIGIEQHGSGSVVEIRKIPLQEVK